MRRVLGLSLGFLLVTSLAVLTPQTAKKPPEKLVFKSALGNVTFDHTKHVERVKAECQTCHDKLFPQDAKAPLNYKANMHKTAEAKKAACAGCHVAGGASFVTTGNCQKCHVKGS
jgi:c(7)-type cytochrome triheme protein